MIRFAIALAALCALPAAAQDKTSGAFMFDTFCATCHGTEARGDGPTAQVLMEAPPDLTSLSKRHDGRFPTAFVIARIDGTDPTIAHGAPMPLYGPLFDGAEAGVAVTDTGEIQTNVVVLDLLAWLESIQQ